MRKTLLVGAFIVACGAPLVMGASWEYVGQSGFSHALPAPGGTPAWMDSSRLRLNSIVGDPTGNVYATAANGNNKGVAGGLTIFKNDGSKVNVDMNALGLPGGVTKLVTAGDGKVYGLQNWYEINWAWDSGVDSRLVRINPNGTVDVVKNFGNTGANNLTKQVTGLTVGGDGKLYLTTSGTGDKYNVFWRYDDTKPDGDPAVLTSLRPGVNNGWSDADRMLNLEYVGGDQFNIINSGGNSWSQDPISAGADRAGGMASNPGWGRNHLTASAYDSVNNRLWTGARGASNRLILSRWDNISPVDGKAGGNMVWHAVGDADTAGTAWVSGLDTDLNGDAWMSFMVNNNTSNINGLREKVIRWTEAGSTVGLDLVDEGIVRPGSDIAALGQVTIDGEAYMYALTLDRTTGEYHLYRTPEPMSALLLGAGLLVLRRRRRA